MHHRWPLTAVECLNWKRTDFTSCKKMNFDSNFQCLGKVIYPNVSFDNVQFLQFGTNNTQIVADLGDNWRKVR